MKSEAAVEDAGIDQSLRELRREQGNVPEGAIVVLVEEAATSEVELAASFPNCA